ncbi:MAG: hypothetical protein WC308_01165 [archaeon]|jgi:hypothetical protein
MRSDGFLISLDAFLSLTLSMLLILMAFFYLSQISVAAWNSVDLKQLSMDEAIVLEKSGALENSVKQRSSDLILSSLNNSPFAYCFDVAVFNDENLDVPLVHALKAGCQKNFSNLVVVERSFVLVDGADANFLIARVSGWTK